MPRTPAHPVTLWSQYLAARAAAMALDCFDIDRKLSVGRDIARVFHRLDARHRQRAADNLRLAFPDWPQARLKQGVRDAFTHLVHLAIEVQASPRLMTQGSWPGRITIGRIGGALRILNAQRPAIMLTGHIGNWEVLGYFLAFIGYRVDAVARPLNNPLINDWVLGLRERHGMRIITKFDAADRMVEVLDSGGVLAFIADQNAGDRGLFVPFFGKLASWYKSIGLLAMRAEVPIICGYTARHPDRYEYHVDVVDIIEPGDWADQPDPLFYITARYARAIETMVRHAPDQYLWMHRRWKSRPRHEREGQPMPAKMRRQLESLPWMDEATMASLAAAM